MEFKGLSEEGLCTFHISVFAQAHIHQISVLINASIQVTPRTQNFDVGLIHKPDLAHLALTLFSDLIGQMGQETLLPITHCFMGEHKAPHQKIFSHVSITQFIAHSKQQDLKYNVSGKFNEVKRCASPLIVSASADFATKHGIPQVCPTLQEGNSMRMAVRAIHKEGIELGL